MTGDTSSEQFTAYLAGVTYTVARHDLISGFSRTERRMLAQAEGNDHRAYWETS